MYFQLKKNYKNNLKVPNKRSKEDDISTGLSASVSSEELVADQYHERSFEALIVAVTLLFS